MIRNKKRSTVEGCFVFGDFIDRYLHHAFLGESTFVDMVLVFKGCTTASVALVVECQRDDKMKPKGRKVQSITRIQDNLVDHPVLEIWSIIHPRIGAGPVDCQLQWRVKRIE